MILRRSGQRKAQDRGAALILVVWAVGLMAVIAALIARDAHLDARESNRFRDALNGDLLIQAGQHLAFARLSQPAEGLETGFPIVCDMEGGRLLINARPISAFIDLNASPEETLAALFVALGAPAPDAAGYAARIADYRDADTTISPGGAELADYTNAGLAYGPANRPFVRTGEVSEVLGLPPELVVAMLPHVTVHAYSTQVEPLHASTEVLAATEVLGTRAGLGIDEPAWTQSADGAPPFAGEPVIVEVLVQTTTGYRTGVAATFGPQDLSLSGNRRLIEERRAGPEPVLAAGASLPAPAPCY